MASKNLVLSPNASHCSSELGTKSKAYCDTGACLSCRTLANLCPDGEILTMLHDDFEVLSGRHIGTTLTLEKTRETIKPHEFLCTEGGAEVYIVDEHCGHDLLLACILENEMKKFGIDSRPNIQYAFTCAGQSFRVKEVSHELAFDNPQGVISQLIAICHFFRSFRFTHGRPDLSCISFTNRPVAYEFAGMKISARQSLWITPCDESSCCIRESSDSQRVIKLVTNRIVLPGNSVREKIIEGVAYSSFPVGAYESSNCYAVFTFTLAALVIACLSDVRFRCAFLEDELCQVVWRTLFHQAPTEFPSRWREIEKVLAQAMLRNDGLAECVKMLACGNE